MAPIEALGLAKILGPLLGAAGRERLRPLVIGATNDVALRYEDVNDWGKLTRFLIDRVDEVNLYEGEEWFIISLETGERS